MSDRLPVLGYADNQRTRVLPSRNDGAIAVFILVAVIAGLIGIVGLVSTFVEYVTAPAAAGIPFPVLNSLLAGGAIALAWAAVVLARRRARANRRNTCPVVQEPTGRC